MRHLRGILIAIPCTFHRSFHSGRFSEHINLHCTFFPIFVYFSTLAAILSAILNNANANDSQNASVVCFNYNVETSISFSGKKDCHLPAHNKSGLLLNVHLKGVSKERG